MKRSKIAMAMDYLDDDLLEGAMADSPAKEREKEGAPATRKAPRRAGLWQRVAAIAAAVVLLGTGGLTALRLAGGNKGDAIVALDVNPSIELTIDKKEQVVAVHAYNAEGKEVVGDLNLKKRDLEVAIDALIGSMLQKGYLSTEQNSVLISVDAESEGKTTRLREQVSFAVSTKLGAGSVQASVITQSFHKADNEKQAEEEGISAGKVTLIKKIVAAGLTDGRGRAYTYARLASLKVNELKLILDSKACNVEGIYAYGEASDGKFIGKAQALTVALERAGVQKENAKKLEIELDFDEDGMVYEIEFESGNKEYEYEIDGLTGAIVDEEIEEKD